MKVMKSWLETLFVIGGAAAIGLAAVAPADAYSVLPSGRTGGTTNQPLLDIGLKHGDIRALDRGYWNLSANDVSSLTHDLSATYDINILTFNNNTLEFDFTIANTTSSSYQSSIMSVFFDISSDIQKVAVNGASVFTKSSLDDRAPGGYQSVDVCIFSSNNCNGGNINKGLGSGYSDTLRILLTGDFSSGGTTLTGISSKWQTQDESYTVAGVPEPLTIVGTLGAIGVGTVLKRRSRQLTASEEKQNENS
ncbi:MAG: cistern family PEP-CTERM protein [Leptolyngbyaceae bacterium]|nr:cistern family PEP-CTERM protein [Leptolyngbyaceae bacterium]